MRAFPLYVPTPERGDASEVNEGMTLRDYFAAHAPLEQWPHYEAQLPPRPKEPMTEIIGNDGEAPTPAQARYLNDWRSDPNFEPDKYPQFSNWIAAWLAYWPALHDWHEERKKQRLIQWPYFYADTILAERERKA
jgi:hypothetical protein